jgi:hypothetical protein
VRGHTKVILTLLHRSIPELIYPCMLLPLLPNVDARHCYHLLKTNLSAVGTHPERAGSCVYASSMLVVTSFIIKFLHDQMQEQVDVDPQCAALEELQELGVVELCL